MTIEDRDKLSILSVARHGMEGLTENLDLFKRTALLPAILIGLGTSLSLIMPPPPAKYRIAVRLRH